MIPGRLNEWKLNKEKLFRLRLNKAWSQETAADRCQIFNVRQYIRLENGETTKPRSETLECLIKGFELPSIEDIILGNHEDPSSDDLEFYYKFKHDGTKILKYKLKPIKNPVKLVVIGIDNTLLKGYSFSWKLVYDYLGLNDNLRKEALRDHRKGLITYNYWIKMQCDMFIEKGLNKKHFDEILRDVTIIRGFFEFVDYCEKRNYALAVVSGGVGTFLENMLPEYKSIFNYAAFNRFIFSEDGILTDIMPTPYDFESKITAIEDMCKDLNLSTKDTIFVGGGYNNIAYLNIVNTCISIDTPSIQLSEAFHHNVSEPDLMKTVEFFSKKKVI